MRLKLKHLVHNAAGGAHRLFEMNMDFYTRSKPYREEYGIRVALENLPQMKRILFGEKAVVDATGDASVMHRACVLTVVGEATGVGAYRCAKKG